VKEKALKWAFIALIVLTGFVCYVNALNNGFVWDDINIVTRNQELGNINDFFGTFFSPTLDFYRPISYLTLNIDYFFWGKNPFGFHLTNVLVHLFAAVLLFFVVNELSKSYLIAFICGFLFVIHPVHVEAVTYVSGRSDSICAAFLIGSLLSLIKGLKKKGNNPYVLLSWFLFLMGLLSRESALSYPFLILSYLLFFSFKPLSIKLKQVIPFFTIAILFFIFRHFFIVGDLTTFTFVAGNNVFAILLFYLKLLFFPVSLHMQHNLNESFVLSSLGPFVSLALILIILFIVFRLIRGRIGFFGLTWFLIGIFPFLGFLLINPRAQIAEHWLYFPSIGIFLLIGVIFSKIKKPVLYFLIPAIASVFIMITVNQNTTWADDITFYKYTLDSHPLDYKLHYNLGNAYLRHNMFDEAERGYRKALAFNPEYVYALNNLGLVFEKRGDKRQALEFYKKAYSLDNDFDVAGGNISRLEEEL
jgi:protein O-mannosyl-transferase